MKKHILVIALGLAAIATLPAQAAGTVGSPFNVTVNLDAKCILNGAAADLDFGTYTAFGSASVAAPTTTVSFQCTNGLTPSTVTLDAINTVVRGLAYTLAVTGGTPTGGSAGTTTTAAVADTRTYTVTGTMASGQAGTGSGAGSVVRTLTVAY